MTDIFNLTSSQQTRAAEIVNTVAKEVRTDPAQYWAGNLLGYLWVPNIDLSINDGEKQMVLTCPRSDLHLALPTIMDIMDVHHPDMITPICGKFHAVQVGTHIVAVEWYIPWERVVTKLNHRMIDASCIGKLLKQFGSGTTTPNLWVLVHLSKILDKRPGVPQPGTPAYSRAAADGSLSERRQNDALRSKVSEAIEEMSEGVSLDTLTSWYVARAEFLGCGFIN